MLKSSLLGTVMALALAAAAPTAQAQELITNGGFETGNFDGWTLGGNVQFTSVNLSPLAHSGLYEAQFGARTTPVTLSQTFAATAGSALTLGFFLDVDGDVDGATPNSVTVTLNGATLLSLTDAPPGNYMGYTFNTVAQASNTLTFAFRHDPDFFYLDDVSATQAVAVPAPAAGAGLVPLLGLAGAWVARRRRERRAA